MRRVRSDAKLFQLDDGAQARIVEMLLDQRLPYHKVVEIIALPPPDGFSLRVGHSAMGKFWQKVCVPEVLRRRGRAVEAANGITSQLTELGMASGEQMDRALIAGLKQKTFEICMESNPSADALSFLMGQVLKVRDQDLKSDELKLKREKFQFDAAKACLKALPELKAIGTNSALSEDEKLTAVRVKLFGELPE